MLCAGNFLSQNLLSHSVNLLIPLFLFSLGHPLGVLFAFLVPSTLFIGSLFLIGDPVNKTPTRRVAPGQSIWVFWVPLSGRKFIFFILSSQEMGKNTALWLWLFHEEPKKELRWPIPKTKMTNSARLVCV